MGFDKLQQNNIENTNKSFYEEILSTIEKIINNKKEIKIFIEKRLNELKNKSKEVEIGHKSKQWHEGFIHPDSLIYRSYMVDPFCVDDDSIYQDMFSQIKKFKEHPLWKDKSIKQIMPFAVQHTIGNYFGNHVTYAETEKNNELFYNEYEDTTRPEISISELKGKNIAVCAEKTAVSENLASFLGLKSYYIISNTCKTNPNDKEEFHAYNIWKTEKNYFIYDPTNPKVDLEKETNNVIGINPAIYPITEEEFKKIENGGTVIVKHIDRISDSNNKVFETKTTERIYGGCKRY